MGHRCRVVECTGCTRQPLKLPAGVVLSTVTGLLERVMRIVFLFITISQFHLRKVESFLEDVRLRKGR